MTNHFIGLYKPISVLTIGIINDTHIFCGIQKYLFYWLMSLNQDKVFVWFKTGWGNQDKNYYLSQFNGSPSAVEQEAADSLDMLYTQRKDILDPYYYI